MQTHVLTKELLRCGNVWNDKDGEKKEGGSDSTFDNCFTTISRKAVNHQTLFEKE
jgi:hypothetical protein